MMWLKVTSLVVAATSSIGAQAMRPPPRWEIAGGFHAGSPAGVSVAIGPTRFVDLTRIGSERGLVLFAVIEPGLGAGRCSIGYGDMRGNLGTYWTVRGTALRRWRNASANYLGAEFSIHALGMGPRIGLFRPVGLGATRGLRTTLDFAIGL